MEWTRRAAIGGLAAGGVMARSAAAAARPAPPPAPGAFLWGVATAAHQIEGGNFNSDYWVLEHIADTSWSEPSGDACDSWNRWREDVALVKAMGLNTYRFSIEWARIEPERGQFSLAALDQYRRLCAACREAGITPMVTFHHFTSPRWVAALGGWENPDIADHLARYCERAAKAIGDLVDWACTINEPNGQVNSFIAAGNKTPEKEPLAKREAARFVGSDRFSAFFQGDGLLVRDYCIAAHHKTTAAIKAAAPHVKTGMTLALQDIRPGPGGEALYKRLWEQSRLPFYQATANDDFVGVQPYQRLITGPDGYLPTPPGVLRSAAGGDSSPDVLAAVIREVHAQTKAPIVITENGLDTRDDALRIRHLTDSVAGLEQCRRDGIPVLGYIHWSLLDNFEWSHGYGPRFGLYACDRQTFARTAKPSAAAYRRLVRRMSA